MPAYSLTLGTVCNFSYPLPVPTVGQATVNPNPFVNTGELIGSPEQVLTLPHMDTKDPDGDSLSFSVAMADRGRDANCGSAQAQRLFFLVHKALSGFLLVGLCSWSVLGEGSNPTIPKQNVFALINWSLWSKLYGNLDPDVVNKALY